MGDTPVSGEVADHAATAGVAVHHSRLSATGGDHWAGVTAALLRPDGHVWWATEQPAATADFASETVKALDTLPARY